VSLKPPAKARVGAGARDRGFRRVLPRQLSPAFFLTAAMLPLGVLVWLVSLRNVDLERMGGYGLVSVLPPTYWLALGLLTVGFVLVMLRPRVNVAWLAGHVVALLTMLHATPTLLYGTLRYSWAWKHIAVVDYLLRHDGTDMSNGDLGVYHQWPGFFTLNALLVRAAGLSSSLSYAAWMPLVNNLLLIAPLVLLYRSMTSDRRLIWTGVWVFFCCSWVGQDYFSPQAFAYVLYVTVIALLLNRVSQSVGGPATSGSDPPRSPSGGRSGFPSGPPSGPPSGRSSSPVSADRVRGGVTWFVLLFLMIAAIATSHQLTPVVLASTLGILAISRKRWRMTLPLVLAGAAFTVAWWLTVAWPFIQANLHTILKSFGSLDSNVGSSLAEQTDPSADQRLIVHVELLVAIVIALLAVIAVVRWKDLRRSPAVILSLAPLLLVAANNYGGEIVFRVYLFALPGTAFLGTAVVYRFLRRPRVRAAVSLVLFPVLLASFVLAYYGKERENYFSPAEVAASRYMYAVAPHGSLIIPATSEYPGAYTDYENYARQSWLGNLTAQEKTAIEQDPAGDLVTVMQDSRGRPTYFILTKSQEAEVEMAGLLPSSTLGAIERIPGHDTRLTVIYQNADAVVMVLTYPPPGAAAPGK
jgi:hypothetical protein